MTMRIILDATGVAALFPEGSEGALELQRQVISQFVGQYIKIADEKLRVAVATSVETAWKHEMRLTGDFVVDYKGAVALTDQARNKIQERLKTLFEQELYAHLRVAVAGYKALIDEKLAALSGGKLDEVLDKKVAEALRRALLSGA